MKKNKVILAVMLALSVAITGTGTGCGTRNSNAAENQKAVVKAAEKEEADKQVDVSEDLEKTEAVSVESDAITENEEETVINQTLSSSGNSDAASGSNTTINSSEASGEGVSSNADSSNSSTSNGASGSNTNSGNSESHTGNGEPAASSGSTSSGENVNNTDSSSGNGTTNSSGNDTTNNPVDDSNNNAPAQPEHVHEWVHVEAAGHYETVTIQEAWDEEVPVYENIPHAICNQCGADITGNTTEHTKAHALAYEGGGYHTEWKYEQTGVQLVHHDAVTEQRWIEDTPAYDVCSSCGVTR